MPTIVNYYIDGASTGGDGSTPALSGAQAAFNSVGAFFDRVAADYPSGITAADVIPRLNWVGTSAVNTNRTSQSSLGDSATNWIEMVGQFPTTWDESKSRWDRTSAANSLFISNGIRFIRFIGMQFRLTRNGNDVSFFQCSVGSGDPIEWVFDRCIFNGLNVHADSERATFFRHSGVSGGGKVIMNRCLMFGLRSKTGAAVRASSESGQLWLRNCTIDDCVAGLWNERISRAESLRVDNTLVTSCDSLLVPDTVLVGDYNVTDAAAGLPGSNSVHSATVVYAGAASRDYQLEVGDDAIDAGDDLSELDPHPPTTDLAGNTPADTWDVGAFESAGTPVVADRLTISVQPPGTVTVGQEFGLVARATNASGQVDVSFAGEVTATLAETPAEGGTPTLLGTTTVEALDGVITFTDLALAMIGEGYEIALAADGLTGAITNPFEVVAGSTGGGSTTILLAGDTTVRPVTKDGSAAQRTIYFEAYEADGTPAALTGAANLSFDGGAATTSTNNVSRIGSTARYKLELTTEEVSVLDTNIKVLPSGTAAFIVGGEAHVVAGAVSAAPLDSTAVAAASELGAAAAIADADLSTFDPTEDTVQLADGGITAAKIANDALTAAKIQDGALAAAKFSGNALTSIADTVLDRVRGGASLSTLVRRLFNKRDVIEHPSAAGKKQLRIYNDAGDSVILTEQVTGDVAVTEVVPEA